MNVILTENVKGLGNMGDVVKVKPGYARNFLVPNKLAVEASERQLKELEHHRRQLTRKAEKLSQEAAAVKARIEAPFAAVCVAGEVSKLADRSTALSASIQDQIMGMRKAMERMGFNGGTILEPGAGIGVFPGLMPEGMAAASHYTGIEFDTMTGGILQQLHGGRRQAEDAPDLFRLHFRERHLAQAGGGDPFLRLADLLRDRGPFDAHLHLAEHDQIGDVFAFHRLHQRRCAGTCFHGFSFQ